MTLTPFTVDRAYGGVSTPQMFVASSDAGAYVQEGKQYLVYGGKYQPPEIVLASPILGIKPIERAANDLAFLDALDPAANTASISGIVRFTETKYGSAPAKDATPLDGIPVRIFNHTHSVEVRSDARGHFVASGMPAGQYELTPQLPGGLVVKDPTSRIGAAVRDGGCASADIDVVFNGRVRGILRGPDGRPLRSTTVDLMPMDVEPEPRTGQIVGTSSVSTNDSGEFEFAGRPAGRYYLGVSIYNAPNPFGPSYPRTYYPGTTDRASATPVVIERGQRIDGFDFSIPAILPKGELEVTVEAGRSGELRFCFVQLEDLFSKWTSSGVAANVVIKRPVVDGQRYQVHVHLEFPGGHLESEPFVFTATTGKTTVTLRPDQPRTLHR